MFTQNQALKDLWIQIAKYDQDYYDSAVMPEGVVVSEDVYYANTTEPMQSLEIIRPIGLNKLSPVIVHIHGGGWICGHKDTYYKYYCMELSKRGYTVLNINYRLAFDHPFPACIHDIFFVFTWMTLNAEKENLDLNHVYLVGDSAGAHLSALCAQIHHSQHLQKIYRVKASPIKIIALGLSCGLYDIQRHINHVSDPMDLMLFRTVFNRRDIEKHPLFKFSSVSQNLNKDFPAAYVLSSVYDIDLYPETQALLSELKSKNLCYQSRIMPKKLKLSHVFNIKLIHKESIEVMDEMHAFFQSFTT